nr:M56 family metallopeptidase [Bacteroidales bacterium]
FPRPCSPFSFGPWIFIHPDGMDEQTLREVLIHEQAHVRGWHTLDILFSQVVCILFWWNPAAWLMRREVRMNLEFIADKAVCDVLVKSERVKSEKYKFPASHETVESNSYFSLGGKADIFHFSLIRAYQYRLLGFSLQTNVATIANNFNVLPLKRRIIMMNLRRTRRTGMAKYILFVPVAAAMLLLSNIDSLARTIADKASSSIITDGDQRPDESPNITKPDTCLTPIDEETLFVVNGRQMSADEFKRQPNLKADNIESATILGKESATAVYGAKGHKGAIIIETKDGGDDKVYETCEQLPEYPGGQLSLLEFMMKNIRYPKAAQEYGVQGKVIVSFIVEKDGTLTEVKAAKIVGVKTGQELPEMSIVAYKPDQSPEETKKAEEAKRYNEGIAALKAEAERAVKALPKRWNPGKDKGKPVRVSFHLPVTFRLQ